MPTYTLTCLECGLKFDEDVPVVMEFGDVLVSRRTSLLPLPTRYAMKNNAGEPYTGGKLVYMEGFECPSKQKEPCQSFAFQKQDVSLTADMHQSWEKTTQGVKELPKGKEAAKAAHAKQHETKRGYKNKRSLTPKAKMQK